MQKRDLLDSKYLANLATRHENNLYTDIIFVWCQVKQILILIFVKSSPSIDNFIIYTGH